MREFRGKSYIALPLDYVVVDIETTGLDSRFCDIIEVAAIKYVNGMETNRFASLIQPPPVWGLDDNQYFVDDFITQLTGITNEMLSTAPVAADVIPQFLQFIGDSPLIGHNVHFDVNFLYDNALPLGLILKNDFINTVRIAKKVLPNLPHHRLSDISAALNLPPYRAHRAVADCETTNACYLAMRSRILETQTEDIFIDSFKKRSKYNPNKVVLKASDIAPTVEDFDDTHPLYGRTVVFTGALSRMPRRAAMQLVANLGGQLGDNVTKRTNYLVVGSEDFVSSVKNGKTNKMQTAEKYRLKGQDIIVLSEDAFFDMIE